LRWDETLKTNSDFDFVLRASRKIKFLFVKGVETIRRKRAGSVSTDVNCDKLRVLERFYREYGPECISQAEASRRFGLAYKTSAKDHLACGRRKAAICLFKKAIGYDPLNFRAYKGLLKAVLKKAGNDMMPDWRMPEPPDDTARCNRIA
jgi:hypothetical protein